MRPTNATVRGPGAAPARTAARGGFTLVELIVAIVVLSVGVLGLAGTAGSVARQVGGAASNTLAANLGRSRLEQIRSRPCTAVAGTSGKATTRGVSEQWRVSPINNNTVTATDTLQFRTARGTRTIGFQTVFAC